PALSILSLHDALPISMGTLDAAGTKAPRDRATPSPPPRPRSSVVLGFDRRVNRTCRSGAVRLAPAAGSGAGGATRRRTTIAPPLDRKSTRLNSSHEGI